MSDKLLYLALAILLHENTPTVFSINPYLTPTINFPWKGNYLIRSQTASPGWWKGNVTDCLHLAIIRYLLSDATLFILDVWGCMPNMHRFWDSHRKGSFILIIIWTSNTLMLPIIG